MWYVVERERKLAVPNGNFKNGSMLIQPRIVEHLDENQDLPRDLPLPGGCRVGEGTPPSPPTKDISHAPLKFKKIFVYYNKQAYHMAIEISTCIR